MLEYGWKRLLSAFLALVLVAGMFPAPAFATETEPETQATVVEETTAESTTPESEAVPETTETVTLPVEPTEEETTPEASTEATEVTVPETTEETIEETTLPENVAAVQALIDALPTVDTVTAEDYDAVQDAYDAYEALTEEEKTLIQGAEKFEELFGWFNAQTATLEDNTCGDNLTWTLADGTLTISGTGDMADYTYSSPAPWDASRNSITAAVIEDGVTSIGEYAFNNCSKLESIAIPEDVTSIGDYAFAWCSKLTSIAIPEDVTSIGDYAFAWCSKLTSIAIPEGVTRIGDSAFYACSGLTSVNIPEAVTRIGSDAFSGCRSLTSVTIPESVTSIGGNVFSSCNSLISMTVADGNTVYHSDGNCIIQTASKTLEAGCSASVIPADGSVTSIGGQAFFCCSGLTSITIPESVTSIGSYAFSGCSGLTSMTVADGNTVYHSDGNCIIRTASKTLVAGCSASVIPADGSVTSIGNSAFYSCEGLNRITIPQGVTNIGSYAFAWCKKLTSIAIPESVTSIGDSAFSSCTSLTDVYYPGTQEQWNAISIGSYNTKLTGATIHIGSNCVAPADHSYEAVVTDPTCTDQGYTTHTCTACGDSYVDTYVDALGHDFQNYVSDGNAACTEDGTETAKCERCDETDSRPEADSALGHAPVYVAALEPTYFAYGSSEYYSCEHCEMLFLDAECTRETTLEELQIPMLDSVITGTCGEDLSWVLTEDGTLTISGTGDMEDFTWDSVPWGSCTDSITAAVISEGITSIGDYAFYNCGNLNSVIIPEGVTSIGGWAFIGCGNLTNVVIPEGVTSIGYGAFCECSSLTSITIPASVTTIDANAFAETFCLNQIAFGHRYFDELTIANSAFQYRHEISTIYVPSTHLIHPAIAQYNWQDQWSSDTEAYRFVSTSSFPLEAISTIRAETFEAEVGVAVPLSVALDPLDTTDTLVWRVIPGSGTAVVTQNGVLTGLTVGDVTVRAECRENPQLFVEADFTILEPTGGAPTAIAIASGGIYENEVEVGTSIPMVVQFTPANTAYRDVTWTVYNGSGTATIDQNGNLTGLTTGTVTVYAQAKNGINAVCTVNVVRYAEEITILVDGQEDPGTLGVGERRYLSFTLSPENTSTTDVTWSFINGTGSASLGHGGNYGLAHSEGEAHWITGVAPGTVTLVATANDSHAVVASVELEIQNSIQPYPVNGGNLYYNTETGYITGSDASVTQAIIPEHINGTTIVGIGADVFASIDGNRNYEKNTNLTFVMLPETLREIGAHAFCGCVNVASLAIPDSVTTVGAQAFSGMSGLKHLTISGEVDSRRWGLGYYYNDNGLQTITYTGSFIRGGTYTTYEEGYTGRMEPGVFCYAQKLILSDSVTTIGDYAFAGSYDITEVVLGANVTTIGKGAFSENYDLTEMHFPDSVTTIGDYAFANSNNLTEVVLGANISSIGERAFYDCEKLTKINLPDSLRFLGKDCFKYCRKLEILEVSGLPDTLSTNEICLTDMVQIPAWMQSATGNQASLTWSMEWPEDGSDPYDVASLYEHKGKDYLYIRGTGTITLFCEESYTGLQTSKTISVEAGLEIQPGDLTCLSSGQSKQLSAYVMPAGKKVSAYWYLNDGDEAFATLTSSGKLTAKDVAEPTGITVNAISDWDGASATMTLIILPKAESIALTREGVPVTADLVLDMQAMPTLTLGTQILPEGALDAVTWTSSDKKVATVEEDGTVNLLKPGAVTITATAADGSKQSARVKLTVYYVDEGKTLTAISDAPTQGLEPGQTAQITVRGKEEIPTSRLIYSIPDNQQKIAVVDENGIVTAGTKPGTATVTITLEGDPLKRKATCKVKVIAMQAEALELSAVAEEPALIEENTVVLDAKHVSDGFYTFTVRAQALTYKNEWAESTNVTWASGNTSIATVKANKDGTATVTVKKGASGECAITATAKDLGKVSANLWLSVRDYAPRLETTSPAMNLYQSSSVDVALLTSYENGIESVSLYEKEEISQHFTAAWADDTLTITALEGVKKGTYTQTLKVTCKNGITYPYTLKIKVTETAPTVTVKQTGKYNLFYNDGTATLNVTVKGEVVEDVTVLEGDFDGAFENGTLTLTANSEGAPGKKVKLEISVAGYEKPVEKTISLSTVTTAPKLKLSATASTISITRSEDRSTSFRVLSGKDVLPLEEGDITYSGSFATHTVANDTITLTLDGTKGGTATLNIKKDNWTRAVKLTHKVTVQTAPPTVKLAASTLKLNRVFPEQGAATTVFLSQGNLTLSDLEITSTAKAGTALADEAAKLSVDWDGANGITAMIEDETIKTGTYAFSCVGTLETGEILKAVTLKVTVSATNPKVKLASTTLKLNRYLAGEEYVSTKVTIPAGYTLDGFANMEETPLFYDNGYLIACLRGEDDLGDTYTIYPVLVPDGGSEPITLDTGLKVKVTTYHSSSLSATVSTKGKLDTMNPDSAITCTVKLKNCTGPIDGVSLSGQDGDLFCAQVDDAGKVVVKLVEGQKYVTNQTYKVTLDMTVCGRPVSKGISFKVTQSTLKVTATPNSLTCYQAIGYGATTLKLTSPATAEFESVTLGSKTTAAFQKALGEDGLTFHPETGRITFRLAHPGLLVPGKSYTLLLDVTPKNAATNVKPTQVKLTVKVQK